MMRVATSITSSKARWVISLIKVMRSMTRMTTYRYKISSAMDLTNKELVKWIMTTIMMKMMKNI